MIRRVVIGSVLLAVTASVSLAQVRQLQMNSPMDANPQVGAGGANRPVQGFVPINGNDIMTGNVSGLAYFHGQTGTINPYQFGGGGQNRTVILSDGTAVRLGNNLGSASLSDFARQSAGTPLNGGTYTGVTQPYYLPSATVSTGQGALYAAPMGGGFDSALVPRYAFSPAMNAAQVRSVTGAVSTSAINRAMSTEPLQAGAPGAVLSSPLFVLRTTELPGKAPDVTATQPAAGMERAPGLSLPGSETGGENKTGAGARPTEEASESLEKEAKANPNLIQGSLGGGQGRRLTAQSEELKAARVSENYLNLAEELRVVQGPQLENPSEKAAGKGAGAVASAREMDIDPFTGKPRQFSMLGATTAPGLSTGLAGATTQGSRVPTTRGKEMSAKGLTELSDAELQAGGKVKRVRLSAMLDAGSSASGYDLKMSAAEKELAGGRFLDAAETYQGALALKPEDPLALVGRANAELAAGLYAGAEFDLKFVFARNPTLVGVTYEARSFVPENRQGYLLDDLQKLTGKKESANMASFLYCYICYETGKRELLDSELQKWGTREGRDEWQVVAARAWGAVK